MTHIRRFMCCEKLGCLFVGKMSVPAAYAALQMERIIAFIQHLIIIISLQKCSMALAKIAYNILAGRADICKYAHPYLLAGNNKTMRIAGIMLLGKCGNPYFA